MPRRVTSPRPVDLDAMTDRVSLPPPPRMPREAGAVSGSDEHVDIEDVATEPPSGAPEAGAYGGASESLSPPTLAPPPADLPFFHGARVGKIAMTLAALLAVGSLSYFMGRARGRIEGELSASRVQLSAIADFTTPRDADEPAHLPAPTLPAAGSLSPLTLAPTEAPTVSTTVSVPAAVAPTSVEPPSLGASTATARPVREKAAEVDAESRAERRARRRAEAEARASAESAATRAEADARTEAEVSADTAAEADEPPAALPPGPPSGELVAGDETAAAVTGEPTSAAGEPVAEAAVAPAPLPSDPLARAVATDPAAQRSLGDLASSSPTQEEVSPALPERPSRSAVRASLHRIVPEARRCGVGGVVKVSIAIAPSGEVARANVIESEAPPEVKACIVAAVSDARFPPFSGSTLVVTYPFRL